MQYVAEDIEEAIPLLLQKLPCWITWVAGPVGADGKFAKLPKGRDGSGTRWQKPEQWMSFPEALTLAQRRGHSGIGLVLPAQTEDGKHIVALDFDNVDLDSPDSPRVEQIRTLHEQLGESYIEASPSGKGLRQFVLSNTLLPQISVSNPLGGKDELFCESSKWVTVTGFKQGGTDVPDATDAIAAIAAQWQAMEGHKATPMRQHSSTPRSAGGVLADLINGWKGWPSHKLRDGDGREQWMLSYAGHLRAQGLAQSEIERLCLQANETHYEDRLEEPVVVDRARRYARVSSDGAKAQGDVLEKVDQTDAGNAARLYELTLGDIRYVPELDTWIVWDGGRWNYDTNRSALHTHTLRVAEVYAKKAQRIEEEINDPGTSDTQRKALQAAVKDLKKWIVQCRNRPRLDAMISLAQKDPRFVISASELDQDPNLLGVANGVVDLRSGVLRRDSKEDYLLRRTSVSFNPNASTRAFRKFIGEVTASPEQIEEGKIKPKDRPALARYLQKVVGYCLTGLVREQVMFMLSGKGSNGKSLLVDLLKHVLEGYCEMLPPEILLTTKAAKSAEQASPVTRMLTGARAVVTSESKEGAQLDVAVVKRHTGDSKMTARGLFERPITFDITHKLLLLTNHPPRIDHMDDALKGRLHVIPFDMRWNRPGTVERDATLPDADKELLAKLKADAEGVLKFFIEGAVAYYQEGLDPPSEVTSFTQGYISEQDTVRRWLSQECVPCDQIEGATAAALHASYRDFCIAEGEQMQCATTAALGRRLRQLGYTSLHSRNGARYGLKVRDSIDIPGQPPTSRSGTGAPTRLM